MGLFSYHREITQLRVLRLLIIYKEIIYHCMVDILANVDLQLLPCYSPSLTSLWPIFNWYNSISLTGVAPNLESLAKTEVQMVDTCSSYRNTESWSTQIKLAWQIAFVQWKEHAIYVVFAAVTGCEVSSTSFCGVILYKMKNLSFFTLTVTLNSVLLGIGEMLGEFDFHWFWH